MLIGDLAQRTGVSARSLRHYERLGLLPVRRRPNRYREFPESAVERVRRVRALLDAGLGLESVAALIPCFEEDGRLAPCAIAREQLATRVRDLDQTIERNLETRRILAAILVRWEEPSLAEVRGSAARQERSTGAEVQCSAREVADESAMRAAR